MKKTSLEQLRSQLITLALTSPTPATKRKANAALTKAASLYRMSEDGRRRVPALKAGPYQASSGADGAVQLLPAPDQSVEAADRPATVNRLES